MRDRILRLSDGSPRQLGPGERMIDGAVYYSAAWLNDPVEPLAIERGKNIVTQLKCIFAPDNNDSDNPKEAA